MKKLLSIIQPLKNSTSTR